MHNRMSQPVIGEEMTFNLLTTKNCTSLAFLFAILLLLHASGLAQSTDPAHPTPISGLPLVGRLATGTYYYQTPVSAGPGTMGLTITPPTGGATVSVSLSGPDCCTADAYVSASSGTSDTVRGASEPFTIPSAQTLLVTINIAVAAGDTVRFTLGMVIGGGSGVIITPPPPIPTPAPATPGGIVCTDLGVHGFVVSGETGLSKVISGQVLNHTTTHPYKGYRRLQWLDVLDITDSEKVRRVVAQIMIPDIIEPGASFSYSAVHTLTSRRRTRYKVQIVYSPYNATDRSQYNDDCNTSNNSTRRQVVGILTLDEAPLP